MDIEKVKNCIINGLFSIDNTLTCLHIDSVEEKDGDEGGYIIKLSGGLESNGKSLFYLEGVASFIKYLMCCFDVVRLSSWTDYRSKDTFSIIVYIKP